MEKYLIRSETTGAFYLYSDRALGSVTLASRCERACLFYNRKEARAVLARLCVEWPSMDWFMATSPMPEVKAFSTFAEVAA